MSKKNLQVCAVDCGASGGKLASAFFDGGRIHVGRYINFSNKPVRMVDSLHVDVFALFNAVAEGFQAITAESGPPDTLGFDTYGAAFALLDRFRRMVHPPYHPLDRGAAGAQDRLYEKLPLERVFTMTGCQCAPGYTLPILYSRVLLHDESLDYADTLVFLPDLFAYMFSGELASERTIAGTSGLTDYRQDGWAEELLETAGIPKKLFRPLTDPGQVLGAMLPAIAEPLGAGGARTRVISVAGHDTASAVAALPGFAPGKAYACVGTNTNMGVETDRPRIGENALRHGFKNAALAEFGHYIVYHDFNTFVVLNALRREWEWQGTRYTHDEIGELAEESESSGSYINLDVPLITGYSLNASRILGDYLIQSGQRVPETHGGWVRCIFESIAAQLGRYTGYLQKHLGIALDELILANGGSWYPLLAQMVSDASGLPVRSGMPYATLAGNMLWQLRGAGELSSLTEMRALAERSFEMRSFEPDKSRMDRWAGIINSLSLFQTPSVF
jgi:sugar (pentulose or hexulose) kinase